LGFHERFPGWFRIHAFTLRLTSCRFPLRIPAGVDVPCRHLGRRQRTWNLVAASFSLPNPPIPKPQTPTPSAAPDAGQRSAILYSIVVSCQRHGKDPYAYLRDVLTRLPAMTNQDDLATLTPARWQPS
jgi:hypothetical protein